MSQNSPSNRSFGLLITILIAALGGYYYYRGFGVWAIYGCMIAVVAVGLITCFFPTLLTPFNKAWMKLGDLMGKVVSPVVLGIIFFILITPVALITRIFGRDELRLKRKKIISYWIDRTPPGPTGDSFKNQF